MNAIRAALLAVRFLLELALLAAWAVVGWNSSSTTWLQATLALALPLLSATIWGLCVSPRAKFLLPLAVRIVIELALFTGASVGLWVSGYPSMAVALIVLELLVLIALLATSTPPGPTSTPPCGDTAQR